MGKVELTKARFDGWILLLTIRKIIKLANYPSFNPLKTKYCLYLKGIESFDVGFLAT